MIPEPSLLPCGCLLTPKIIDGAKTLEISPCRVDCHYLHTALAMAYEQNKPVEYEPR